MKKTSVLRYRPYQSSDQAQLEQFVLDLYSDGLGAIRRRHVRRTVKQLAQHPDQGMIMMFAQGQQVIGYAILINFWSNEYCGNILNIDELYVTADYRGQGIASSFIQYLIKKRFLKSIGLQLEVTHQNIRARKLYDRLGFKIHKNNIMFMPL